MSTPTAALSITPVASGPRAVTADDRDAIQRLLTDARLPTAGVAEILAAHPGDFLVVDEPGVPGQLSGVAGLEVRGSTALLRSVAVSPTRRGQSVGRVLVERLLAEAELRGLCALYLLTETAEDYFPRFGFVRTDRATVPREIADTLEFRSACPASAVAMAKALRT